MAKYRVSFGGKKIGALGLSSHLMDIVVETEQEKDAPDKAREELVRQGWYNTHEHIHTYACVRCA